MGKILVREFLGGFGRAGEADKVEEAALAREADGAEDVGVGEGPEGYAGRVGDGCDVEERGRAERFTDEELACGYANISGAQMKKSRKKVRLAD